MIGFQEGLADQPRPEEGAETAGLSKNQLYSRVASTYFIPPLLSRGVTRDYLLQVLNNQVFRVTLNVIKHFEVDLDKAHTTKTSTQNNSLVVRKLNLLLSHQNNRPLGFDEYDVPESTWLYRAARYIDQTNILELFERAVRPEPPANGQSRPIVRTYHGRLFASRYFFENHAVRANKKIWESVRAISEAFKAFQSMTVSVDVLARELEESRRRVAQMQANVNDLVGKCAFTYAAIIDQNIRPEIVMQGGAGYTEAMRDTINRAAKL